MSEHNDASERPRDQGFGTRVGGSGQRLLNRDGSFAVRRTGLRLRELLSLYHSLLVMSWPAFLVLVAVVFLATNTLFALAYLASGPDAIMGPGEHSFGRCFFFSVATLSGIGYGHLAPLTLVANLVMTVESLAGLITLALSTGLVFARFSRPKADFVFSNTAVIAPYRGGRALMFRIANRRRNQIVDLQVRVLLSMVKMHGQAKSRTFDELALERNQIAFFPLSWTIVHPIDSSSPFLALTEEALRAADAEILIVLQGIDDTTSQSVHARSSYMASEVVWGASFGNMFERDEHGRPVAINLRRIHDINPTGMPHS